MFRNLHILLMISACIYAFPAPASAERPYVTAWVEQIGSPEKDEAAGIMAGMDGMLYMAGTTFGKLYGNERFGSGDIFLAKISADGKLYWTKQYGTGRFDKAMGMLENSRDLSVYGVTDGLFARKRRLVAEAEKENPESLPDEPFNVPSYIDIFVINMDSDGNMASDRQYETKLDKTPEQAAAAKWLVSEGLLYSGRGDGKDVLKYARYNDKQISGIHSYTRFVTDDGCFVGRVVIPDVNDDEDNNYDAFASRDGHYFNRYGTNMWDEAVVATNGLGYIAGISMGDFDDEPNMGGWDAFILKESDKGPVWSRTVGTDKAERVKDIKTDDKGNVYMIGETEGSLRDCVNAGDADIFIVKYDKDGNELWHSQIGTCMADTAVSALVGADDALYLTGHTEGSFPGCFNYGGEDVFVLKLEPDKEEPPAELPAGQGNVDRQARPKFIQDGALLADQIISDKDVDKDTELSVGDVVIIKLPRSDTAGENWALSEYDKERLEKLPISYKKVTHKKWAFGAVSEGRVSVIFHNRNEELSFNLRIIK